MKIIPIFFLLVGIMDAVHANLASRPFDINTSIESNAVLDFVTGFLEGLNVKGDINKMLECVKGGEGVIDKIITAIKLLIHIDLKHVDDIIKGITMLVDATQELITILQPCTQSVQEIQKLINAFININFIKLVLKMITHESTFIHDIMDAIDAFGISDFKRAGRDIGHLMYLLFIESRLESDPLRILIKIIKGIFNGLGNDKEFVYIMKCFEAVPMAYPKLLLANKILERLDWMNGIHLVEDLIELYETLVEILVIIRPCTLVPGDLINIYNKILATNIHKLLDRFLGNIVVIAGDVTTAIYSLQQQNYFGFGHSIGLIGYVLIIE